MEKLMVVVLVLVVGVGSFAEEGVPDGNKPAWRGVVLVKPNGKLGFFLSRYDDLHEEHIILEDQVVLLVAGEKKGSSTTYRVPESFKSTVSDIVIGKQGVVGVGNVDYCRFRERAKPLPWLPEDAEMKGKLFLLPFVDEKILSSKKCAQPPQKSSKKHRKP